MLRTRNAGNALTGDIKKSPFNDDSTMAQFQSMNRKAVMLASDKNTIQTATAKLRFTRRQRTPLIM